MKTPPNAMGGERHQSITLVDTDGVPRTVLSPPLSAVRNAQDLDTLMRFDRAYFDLHPNDTEYFRYYVPGELDTSIVSRRPKRQARKINRELDEWVDSVLAAGHFVVVVVGTFDGNPDARYRRTQSCVWVTNEGAA